MVDLEKLAKNPGLFNPKSPYLTIISPLDGSTKKRFDVQTLVGSESISQDFFFKANISSRQRMSDNEAKILMDDKGMGMTLSIGYTNRKGKTEYRYINGEILKLVELGFSRENRISRVWRYEVHLGSWLSRLRFKECRIFQDSGNTAIRIATSLMRECGITPNRRGPNRIK